MAELKMGGYDYLPQPLDKDKEEKLTILAYEKDTAAKKKLIEHNLRLVFYVSNKFKKNYKDGDDLTSVGTIGLIKAIDNFDPNKKIKLSTYAARCIENEILMYLRKSKKHENIKYLQDTLYSDNKGNEMKISDLLGTDKEEVHKEVSKKTEIDIVKTLVEKLPETEREIIKYRYGIDCEPKRQAEIAELLNISQSYISRIEKKVIEKLRKKYEKITS
jgi:RNA polymerase sporulation-specific sigma factor